MANPPAGQTTLFPGQVPQGNSSFPQYGMLPGTGNTWSVVTATSSAQKATFVSQGAILWFSSEAAANSAIAAQSSPLNGNIPGGLNPANWLTGLGGLIASGLESGFVAFITDLWSGIVGYVEIFTGALLALIIIIFVFRADLMSLAPLALALAGLFRR